MRTLKSAPCVVHTKIIVVVGSDACGPTAARDQGVAGHIGSLLWEHVKRSHQQNCFALAIIGDGRGEGLPERVCRGWGGMVINMLTEPQCWVNRGRDQHWREEACCEDHNRENGADMGKKSAEGSEDKAKMEQGGHAEGQQDSRAVRAEGHSVVRVYAGSSPLQCHLHVARLAAHAAFVVHGDDLTRAYCAAAMSNHSPTPLVPLLGGSGAGAELDVKELPASSPIRSRDPCTSPREIAEAMINLFIELQR